LPLHLVVSGADRGGVAGEQPVDPAEHRILFVQQARNVQRRGGEQSGKRGIAAEADHRVGCVFAVQPLRLATPSDHRARGFEPADRPAAEPSGGQDVHRHTVEQPRESRAAVVGDQQHAVATALQLRGERVGRDHVAAGPSGSEDEIHAVRLSPLHFTTYGERVKYGFRRVKASSKPIAIDRASIELPP